MKHCSMCKCDKPKSEFYANRAMADGLQNRCKLCTRLYKMTPEYRTYARAYANQYRDRNPPTEEQKLAHREAQRRWEKANLQKKRAHKAVSNALRKGSLTKRPCERCGAIDKVEAHHDSYEPDRYLDVHWLCRSCHYQTHNEKPKQSTFL